MKAEINWENGTGSIQIVVPALHDGWIPKVHTGFGEDISPEIQIHGLLEEVRSLAVVVSDLDVPFRGIMAHWVMWNVDPVAVIPGRLPKGAIIETPIHACQGIAYGVHCYRGPKQPPFVNAVHRYSFEVYALDCMMNIPPDSRRNELLKAMAGHMLQYGSVEGKYRK